MAISRAAMMATGSHHTMPLATRATRAPSTATLSARGSRKAPERVAPCLRAVAWFREEPQGAGLVEAVEAPDPHRWVVGVQWHPENLVRLDNATGRAALGIFQGFVAALAGR